MKQKLAELTEIKERMANIIEICEINSHQNEKWIIGLNKLYTNYEKMIQLEDTRLKEIKKNLVVIEKVREQFVTEFLTLKEQKIVYAEHVESHLMTQSAISDQIAKSSSLPDSSRLFDQIQAASGAEKQRTSCKDETSTQGIPVEGAGRRKEEA